MCCFWLKHVDDAVTACKAPSNYLLSKLYINQIVAFSQFNQKKFGWDYSGSSNLEELQLILEECIMIR